MDTAAILSRLHRSPLRVAVGHRHHVPLDMNMDWEAHDGLEVAFHRSGQGVVEFASGGTNVFAAGAIEIYSPGLAHKQVMSVPGDDWFVRVDAIPEFAGLRGLSLNLAGPPEALIEHEFAAVTQPLPSASAFAAVERDHRCTALLLRLLAQAEPCQAARRPSPAQRQACEARRLIRERAATLGRIEEVADALGLSHDHLRHVFKRAYGRSLVRELMEARVALAERQLRATRDPLAVIARRAGFDSEGYLCRVFRQLRGVSPGSLRRP